MKGGCPVKSTAIRVYSHGVIVTRIKGQGAVVGAILCGVKKPAGATVRVRRVATVTLQGPPGTADL
jgi:hypothetical protein